MRCGRPFGPSVATVTRRSSARNLWSSGSVIAMAVRREGMSVLQREAAPQDGLGYEAYVEAFEHGVAHVSGQARDIARARTVVADDRERVPRREPYGAVAQPLRESRVLDEPRGGQLHAPVGLGPARHRACTSP